MRKSVGLRIQEYLDSPQSHLHHNLLSLSLFPLTVIFWLIGFLRREFYKAGFWKSHRLDHPVISIGNLTLGGTGKTPFEIYLIKLVQDMGLKPLLLSRGYGHSSKSPKIVHGHSTDDSGIIPDEIRLISKTLPEVCLAYGKDRVLAYRMACQSCQFDLVILDDGFQHLRIHRDLDIVMLDYKRPLGSGRLLPSGNLREPRSSLKRADLLVLNLKEKSAATPREGDAEISLGFPNALIGGYNFSRLYSLQKGMNIDPVSLSSKRAGLVLAIGDPDSFIGMAVGIAKIDIIKIFLFRDHHDFTQTDMAKIEAECRTYRIDCLFTSEKDAVRLEKICFAKPEVYVIQVQFNLMGKENLLKLKIQALIKDAKRS